MRKFKYGQIQEVYVMMRGGEKADADPSRLSVDVLIIKQTKKIIRIIMFLMLISFVCGLIFSKYILWNMINQKKRRIEINCTTNRADRTARNLLASNMVIAYKGSLKSTALTERAKMYLCSNVLADADLAQ